MKITPISITNNLQTINKKNLQKQEKTISTNYKSIPAFYGRDLVKTNLLPLEILKNIPKGYSIQDLIKMAQTEENKLGQGANSIVYSIPRLDDYVLKVLNKDDPNRINMNEFPSNINLGQPVWQDDKNPRILILKKIEGKEHSIPNWSKTIWDGANYTPLNVTKEQAKLFHTQLNDLAQMPQSAFDELTEKAKILSDKGYKLDSINPNNLIVDTEKQQIHIIDYFKVANPNETHLYQNSYMDLVAIALDFTLFPEYYDKMDETEKADTIQNAKTIRDKLYKGAEKSSLSCDDERFKTFIRTTSRWFPAHSVPNEKTGGVYFRYYDVRLEDFMDMIYNPEQWASKR